VVCLPSQDVPPSIRLAQGRNDQYLENIPSVDRTAEGDPHRRFGFVGGDERVRPQLAGIHVEVTVRIERKGGRRGGRHDSAANGI
jgi:hypothetical protein